MKRIFALVLCLLMLAAALPMAASAETYEELCQRIVDDYQRALVATGKPSLGGFCGELASWQLYFNGITDYVNGRDGNKYYETYCDQASTSGGYRIKAYSAEGYTLEQALNEATMNGREDAYNILVCFEWTNTEAGNIYGHAVFVYAIIDGIVHCTESFDTSMGTKEGQVIKCSIPEFMDYYDDWTLFEGIIVFGEKGYESKGRRYAADMFVEATAPAVIMSEPCDEECNAADSQPVRNVQQGERLLVTGLIENTLGQYYYRINDSGKVGYVPAAAVMPLRFNYEQICMENPNVPQELDIGQDFKMSGAVAAKRGAFDTVCVELTDINNRVVMSHTLESERSLFDLSNKKFNDAMDFGKLEKGYYSYNVYADGINYYIHNGKMTANTQRVCVLSRSFKVDKRLPDYAKASNMQQEKKLKRNGWYWEAENWHYYEDDQPKTGWFTYKGVTYYLQHDGSVTQGMAKVEDRWYFFTNTGAMRTGWVENYKGTYYMLENGERAYGWQTIEGKRYFFGPDGLMLHSCWFSQGDGQVYYLHKDGSAAVGVARIQGNYYTFYIDGRLRTPWAVPDEYLVHPEYA